MNSQTITFIGGGNMASALINGLLVDGTPANSIIVAEPDAQKREALAANFGVRSREDNDGAAQEADLLVLAVKPQIMGTVAKALAPAIQQNKPLCLSIAAGIRYDSLKRWLGNDIPLVRTMPNMPSILQAGATGLYADNSVDNENRNRAERIMRSVGLTSWVEKEVLLDAITAVSGSGPAYFFLFMEAMEQMGEELGLSPQTAHLLVLQTALGAARMAMENDIPLSELRKNVTSPGGTTEQAIMHFEENGLRDTVAKAMQGAYDRSIELSETLGKN